MIRSISIYYFLIKFLVRTRDPLRKSESEAERGIAPGGWGVGGGGKNDEEAMRTRRFFSLQRMIGRKYRPCWFRLDGVGGSNGRVNRR